MNKELSSDVFGCHADIHNLEKKVQSSHVLRGHLEDKEKWSFKTGDLFKRGPIHMKISTT